MNDWTVFKVALMKALEKAVGDGEDTPQMWWHDDWCEQAADLVIMFLQGMRDSQMFAAEQTP